jgi:hypothetical protein
MGIPYFTTMAAAQAAVEAIQALQHGTLRVKALQEYHGEQFEVQSSTFEVENPELGTWNRVDESGD